MRSVDTLPALRRALHPWRMRGQTVALVPTMGNLHRGHLKLVEEARRRADRTVVSIFVNPTQFGPGEDFASYPRTPEQDAEQLRAAGVDLLYQPAVRDMYPADPATMTFVEVPGLSEDLCGRFRPGHFRGVATVVLKLFHQVQPDLALFGEKDYQQLLVIRRLVADLDLPIAIHGVPTVREPDGLALSSRNAYLNPDERRRAARLYACLEAAAAALGAGRRDFAQIEGECAEALAAEGLKPDYVAIRRQSDLAPPGADDRRLIVLAAVRLGRARLIDNRPVEL
ncbi:pantoate--beta-alanine ligase [Candidatus Methylocalor cossyra]|uniref:Pantothenate synthetase n=1 Tax=Candidatus Methylocalor cossyra TaxID=3108543 RepID=A0ABM9NI54_9GAMM